MGKAKLLDVTSIRVGMNNVKNGVGFGAKLAAQNKVHAERLTNRQASLNRLTADINQYGLSEARFKAGKDLFDAELDGRTMASVIASHSNRLANALDKCIDKTEEKNVTTKFKNIYEMELAALVFLQGLFVEVEEKVEVAKAEAVEVAE